MATKIYDSYTITLVDGTEVYLTPLKIKYLREFMDAFSLIKMSTSEDETILYLSNCARIAMKQYHPSIKTIDDVEDSLDLASVYRVLDVAAGIKIGQESKEPVKKQATDSGPTWDDLDLAKLESEVFLLGIWKDYEELESSLSMAELTATLESKREADYQEKKFLAGMQGIDLDEQSGKSNAWEEMKARVFSGGKAQDSNDIISLQGASASSAGFGIGMGLDYEDLTKK